MKEKGPTYQELEQKLAAAEKTIVDLNERLAAVGTEGKRPLPVSGKPEKPFTESVQNLRNLLDASSLGMTIFTAGGQVVYANRALLDFCGYKTAEEFNAESIQQFYTPESFKAYQEREEKQRLGQPVPQEYEATVKRVDGEILNVRVVFNEVVWGGERQTMATYLDITEQKRVEAALKESEEKFAKAFRSSPEAIIITEIETGMIVDANEAVLRATGYSYEEMIGHTVFELNLWVDPEDRKDMQRVLKEKGRINSVRIKFRMKSGEIRAWNYSVEPIEIGGRKCIITVLSDVTERERAEEALKESERKMRSIFSVAPIGIGVVVNRVLMEVNQRFCDMLGYSRDEIIGRDGLMIYADEEEYKRVGTEKYVQINESGTGTVETRLKRKDGKIIDVLMSSTPIVPSDLSQGVTFTATDITERKKATEALKESEERFRALFETMAQGVVYHEADGKISIANPAAQTILGLSLEQMQEGTEGNKRLKAIHEDGSVFPAEQHPVTVALSTGKPVRDVVMGILNPVDNDYRWLIIDVVPEFKKGEERPYRVYAKFRDNTIRRQLEEKIGNQARLIDTVSDAIVSTDKNYVLTSWNKAAEELYGWREEEVIGKNIMDLLKVELNSTLGDIRESMDKRGYWKGESVHYTRHGRRLNILDSVSIKRDAYGNNTGAVSVFKDITDRKKMEESLRYYADLVESVSDAIISVDAERKLISWNKAAEELFGWSRDEVMGKDVSEILPPLFVGISQGNVDKILFKDGKWSGEGVHFRKDGKKIDTLESITLAKNEKGEVLGWVTIFRDVTGSKRMAQELAAEIARRRILIEQSRDGIVIVDQDGKVNEANRRFAEMLGYSPEEVLNLHVWDWDTQWTKEHLMEMISTIDEAGDHFETYHRRKDGTTFDVEISSNGAVFAGQKLVFCVCRDITERKKMEQALRESEERFSKAFHNSPDDVLITTVEDGTIIEINDSCIRRSGYTREDFIGHSLLDMPGGWVDSEERKLYVSMLHKNGRAVDVEGRFYIKGGGIRTVLINGELIQIGDKQCILNTGRDITERKQMEESIRYHASLVENVSDAVVSSDMNYKIMSWNKAAERMYGWTEKEVIGKSVMSVTKPVFINTEKDEILQLLRKNGSWRGEAVHYRKDGRPINVLLSISLMNDEKGNEKGAVTIFTDITERKQAEEKHQTILETALDGFHILDMKGRIIEVNDSYCRMTGYTRDELLKMHIGDIEANKGTGPLIKIIKLPESGYDRFETQHIAKDGRLIDLEVTLNYLNIGDGQVFSFLHDITVRKRNEDRIKLLNMTLRSIRNVNQMITREKDRKKLIKGVCDALVEGRSLISCWIALFDNSQNLLDYAVTSSAVGSFKPMLDLLQRNKVPQCVEKALRRTRPVVTQNHEKLCRECPLAKNTPESGSITIRLQYSGNTYGILNVSVPPGVIADKDEIELYQEVANDISFALYNIELEAEHELMEQERLRVAKLDSIGTLAGGIAHDFNNLLAGILGNIGMAKLNIKPAEPAYELLDEAEKATVRTRDLTQQLLTFARGGKPVKKMVDINALVKETATFALRGSQVKLELSLSKNLWQIEADEGQISQVIQNLVINADEAMPEGGILSIDVANIVIEKIKSLPLKAGNYIVINVKDTGIGMYPQQLQRVFEPYYTTKQRGSGLGLTSAFSIVRNHNGYLFAESTPGKGSTFHVYLPASRKYRKGGKKMTAEITGKAGGRILVMDDEPIIQRMLKQMLTLLGYEVVITADGTAAIDRYVEALDAGNTFNAVIMDLTIPGGMGGREAVKKLLEKDPSATVIVSSGYATDPIMSEYKKYGFSAVVAKPYTINQLEETLRNLFKKKKK